MGAGADEVQAYRQPQDAKALALAVPPLTAWTSRQGDRMGAPAAKLVRSGR